MLIAACAKTGDVPAYVEIPAVAFVAGPGQGGSTSKITDAWVTLDERTLGVWELPARIPALAEGAHVIGVAPAVKRNGAFDDRIRYPFYTAWSGQALLAREGTSVVQPTTAYVSEAAVWHEGFDDPFSLLINAAESDTPLVRFTPTAHPELLFLENGPCAGFRLDAAHRFARVLTDEDFEASGGPVFLEIDHRGDIAITVGLIYVAQGLERVEPYYIGLPTLRSDGSMPWNKAYIDLSGLFNSPVSQRDIYIEVRLPEDRSNGQAYIDNVKLLRMQP
ncbi:MAG: hypothetical protein ACK4L7_03710 [Flavobacteriales bacterium]